MIPHEMNVVEKGDGKWDDEFPKGYELASWFRLICNRCGGEAHLTVWNSCPTCGQVSFRCPDCMGRGYDDSHISIGE